MVPYKELFLELDRRDIQYLVAGGFAVNFHQVQRATIDLDLILKLEKTNILKFIEMMKALNFRPRLPVDPSDFADEAKRKEWIEEKGLMVFTFHKLDDPLEVIDVFAEEPKPFSTLEKRQLVVDAFGVKIKVVGKSDLIEMKKAAGRDKDLFDISQLLKSSGDD